MGVSSDSSNSSDVQPILEDLGVRVSGTAPAAVDAATLADLLRAHHVVIFEPSDLDDEAQQRLLDQLGSSYIHPLAKMMGVTTMRCSHIIDDADHPPYQDHWHTDVTWDPEPPAIGSLRAIEMPEDGGNTVWANMHVAAQTLPDRLREQVEGRTALHDMGPGKAFVSKTSAELVAQTREQYPGVERPIIGSHRDTGQPYLNVNSGFTSHIVGMDRAESDALLDEIYHHIDTLDCQYRHVWTVGEFVVWDEQATQHRAVGDHFPQRREMSRYVVR